MPNPKKNAPDEGGNSLSKLAGGGSGKSSNVSVCSANDIAKVVLDLRENGVDLKSAAGDTQHATLPKALLHRGPLGLSTYEAVAAG
ncbi:MAG: hypothetical protein Q7T25_16545, partial [Sideroxyarcus sp.]|nr:hypothetical protein [Sideroxyarcus sp.]